MRPRKAANKPSVKEALLDAAAALFTEKGPDGTSIDEIVKKAGCNKRMVYHYFGSKEMLYRAVLLETYHSIEKFEEQVIRENLMAPPSVFVEKIVTAYLRFLGNHPQFVNLLSWENLNRGQTIRHLPVRATKNAILDGLERNFARANLKLGREELEQFFLNLSALCFFTYSNRHTMKQILGADPAAPGEIDRRARHIVALLSRQLA
jgi:TetR/AcrR family transcriptional regulator